MDRSDRGSGVVDTVLVTGLVLALFLLVLQVGLVLHARTVLVAAAAEGARYGADADRTPDQGAARAGQVVAQGLPGLVDGTTARAVDATPGTVDIEVSSRLRVLFLPIEPVRLTVHGHALQEGG